jgi:hypothetical protein
MCDYISSNEQSFSSGRAGQGSYVISPVSKGVRGEGSLRRAINARGNTFQPFRIHVMFYHLSYLKYEFKYVKL